MSQVKHHNSGITYWRSLEQLADSPEIRDLIAKEFPNYDADALVRSSRRDFLKWMGASMALAGLTLSGCRRAPKETLAPYTSNPRDRVPGVAEHYATTWELAGVGVPLLVTCFDGRPIKIEGNPSHPMSLGASDAFAQASVLELYDPDRSRKVRGPGNVALDDFIRSHFDPQRGNGEGIAVLAEPMNGVASIDMKERFEKTFPKAKWFVHETVEPQPQRTLLHLDKADTVLLIDADILGLHPASVRYAADWASRRRSADDAHKSMSRVYMVETCHSLTGAAADVRLGVDPFKLRNILIGIANGLDADSSSRPVLPARDEEFIRNVVEDLKKGNGVVEAGLHLSPTDKEIVRAINQKLGAVGKTVEYIDLPDNAIQYGSLKTLAGLIGEGKVQTLLILGGNPAYTAPVNFNLASLIQKVPVSLRLGLYEDETTACCQWHIPQAHYLEAWGDARSWDGACSITQPMILPLHGGISAIELLAKIIKDDKTDGLSIVKRAWVKLIPADFDAQWHESLQLGLMKETRYGQLGRVLQLEQDQLPPGGFCLRFTLDHRVHDGRFANNGWLQETPDPLTKITWDNALLISKIDADRLEVVTGDLMKVTAYGNSLEVAAYVMPGQPVGVMALSVGYGRTRTGAVGNRLGFNANLLRSALSGRNSFFAYEIQIEKMAGTYTLALTQNHHIMDDIGAKETARRVGDKGKSGPIIRETSLEEYEQNPKFANEEKEFPLPLQLFDQKKYPGPHAWGLTVDLNTCIGCNACAVACQSENNIPVVGKDQVLMHREMNWIRIDRYFKGAANDPDIQTVHQPMMCQQCENAPCEQVCPVGATVHDAEGLNTMVYNRCIGTRYCSNNCPFKARRFNYFDFHSKDPRGMAKPWLNIPDNQQTEVIDKIKRMVFNPEVSVRMRGVMEKCTFCVQRIHSATINARAKAMKETGSSENARVADGEVKTACQQACPTQAIVFGDLSDPNSKVAKIQRENPRAYVVLEELNVRPRAKYLAKLRNPWKTEEKA